MTLESFVAHWIVKLRNQLPQKTQLQINQLIQVTVDNNAPSDWSQGDLDEVSDRLHDLLAPPQSGTGDRAASAPNLHKSPFRFVTIPDRVVLAPPEVREPSLSTPLAAGYSGAIQVRWAVETPILIGSRSGEGDDQADAPIQIGDEYVIPGATLRGMLRSTLEIVCRARLTQVNAHHRYPLRDFTHSSFKRRAGGGSLRAGWLEKVGGTFTLTPCEFKEIKIRHFLHDLPDWNAGARSLGQQHLAWLKLSQMKKYTHADMLAPGSTDRLYFDTAYSRFQDIPGGNTCRPSAAGRDGFYVFSGPLPMGDETTPERLDQEDAAPAGTLGLKKKHECVFFEIANPQTYEISQAAFDRFELMNCTPSRNGMTPAGNYQFLRLTLDEGGRVPVFYTGDPAGEQADLEIGLTRLFKIGHDYSVGEKLAREHEHAPDPAKPDIVEALFGHVFEARDVGGDAGGDAGDVPANARKGRVAFGFAYLANGTAATTDGGDVDAVMMAPRASFAPFYLKGTYKDWSDPNARLAGRKRYFPRFANAQALENAQRDIANTLRTVTGTQDMLSRLRFLRPQSHAVPLVFEGTVRVHNVTDVEIGALLWALTHGGDPAKPYRHMIGRAKPAGAGQSRVQSITLSLQRNDGQPIATAAVGQQEAAWELPQDGREGWTQPGAQSLTPFLRAFDSYMRGQPNLAAWPRVPEMQELLACSKPGQIAAPQLGEPQYPVLRSGLNEFATIRASTKHHHNQKSPEAPATDRFLRIPPLSKDQILTPYAEA